MDAKILRRRSGREKGNKADTSVRPCAAFAEVGADLCVCPVSRGLMQANARRAPTSGGAERARGNARRTRNGPIFLGNQGVGELTDGAGRAATDRP